MLKSDFALLHAGFHEVISFWKLILGRIDYQQPVEKRVILILVVPGRIIIFPTMAVTGALFLKPDQQYAAIV